jgi:hypothetical protein
MDTTLKNREDIFFHSGLWVQAMRVISLLRARHLIPYHGIVGMSYIQISMSTCDRRVHINCLGEERGAEVFVHLDGGEESSRCFQGDNAIDHTVNWVEEVLTASQEVLKESPFWQTAGQAAEEVSHWPAWRRDGFWAPTRGIQN